MTLPLAYAVVLAPAGHVVSYTSKQSIEELDLGSLTLQCDSTLSSTPTSASHGFPIPSPSATSFISHSPHSSINSPSRSPVPLAPHSHAPSFSDATQTATRSRASITHRAASFDGGYRFPSLTHGTSTPISNTLEPSSRDFDSFAASCDLVEASEACKTDNKPIPSLIGPESLRASIRSLLFKKFEVVQRMPVAPRTSSTTGDRTSGLVSHSGIDAYVYLGTNLDPNVFEASRPQPAETHISHFDHISPTHVGRALQRSTYVAHNWETKALNDEALEIRMEIDRVKHEVQEAISANSDVTQPWNSPTAFARANTGPVWQLPSAPTPANSPARTDGTSRLPVMPLGLTTNGYDDCYSRLFHPLAPFYAGIPTQNTNALGLPYSLPHPFFPLPQMSAALPMTHFLPAYMGDPGPPSLRSTRSIGTSPIRPYTDNSPAKTHPDPAHRHAHIPSNVSGSSYQSFSTALAEPPARRVALSSKPANARLMNDHAKNVHTKAVKGKDRNIQSVAGEEPSRSAVIEDWRARSSLASKPKSKTLHTQSRSSKGWRI